MLDNRYLEVQILISVGKVVENEIAEFPLLGIECLVSGLGRVLPDDEADQKFTTLQH